MKKILCILIVSILLPLSSCAPPDISTAEKIVPPLNTLPPILGEWKVYRFVQVNSEGLNHEDASKWIGKTAFFDSEAAGVGDDSCTTPIYKTRNVDSEDYLLYRYKLKPDSLGINHSKIQVITVTSKNQFFYEFIKTEDSEIIVNVDDTFFYLNKVSDNTNSSSRDKYIKKETNQGVHEGDGTGGQSSGILLGLKSFSKTSSKSSNNEWTYRTLWISYINSSPRPVYEMKDLFVPRKSGFWKLGVTGIMEKGTLRDTLYAYPADKEVSLPDEKETSAANRDSDILKSILYVSNDYLSIEHSEKSSSGDRDLLKVLPIDNVETANTLKISDISGESGRNALIDGASKYISSNQNIKNKYQNDAVSEESFGVVRRNGHWIMKGRLNSIFDSSYADFNIKAIPPSKLVIYDELCLPWNEVKSRIPEALDVYTSPNRDMAVILTANNIFIYPIENGNLSEKPSGKIRLKDKETVVMAEWCTGRYTEKWEKEFLKNDTAQIQ